jgi:3-phosphoshikimate 1-carboxyvinyltransferase
MAFAIAALRAQGDTLIRNSERVAISYPSFFADLERLLER